MADETLFQLLHTEVVAAAYGGGRGSGDEGQRTGLTVLEGMGFRVGQGLAERLPRGALVFREELDTIKFLCRDLWGAVFRKQTDNLRTNHQFLAFTCGLLRGTLSALGIESSVTASVASLPVCKFQVVIQKA
ncbi:trafficking protein particle complex subunit 6A isoform X4 [Phascolarctos cinereus]|uniref:Trafficking protein particle complex subunit 6A isoform X6 n=1 Tax=Phascolarctos cinereus TaxID=38626 RepID=A0A6P5LLW0_PHACI|nr:trafficking protein particle complex subunit 6A isoform X6 [Phascolarctos cinereus]